MRRCITEAATCKVHALPGTACSVDEALPTRGVQGHHKTGIPLSVCQKLNTAGKNAHLYGIMTHHEEIYITLRYTLRIPSLTCYRDVNKWGTWWLLFIFGCKLIVLCSWCLTRLLYISLCWWTIKMDFLSKNTTRQFRTAHYDVIRRITSPQVLPIDKWPHVTPAGKRQRWDSEEEEWKYKNK